MPVFQLIDEHIFPDPDMADKSGLLAVGGDLSESRLLLAYSLGIFPWFSEGDPILWWSPDPRLVLIPQALKISRSLKQTLKKNQFQITMDRAFEDVIEQCSSVHRRNHGDTWITQEMIDAYISLHYSGYAHSIEAWSEGKLAGGLYGISLGSVFFGESMFTIKSNASKVAFVSLVQQLAKWHFSLIDCQVTTPHLKSLGACEVSRTEFLIQLKACVTKTTRKGQWESKM